MPSERGVGQAVARTAALAAVGLLLGAVVTSAHALVRIRRRRSHGATVGALDHDVDLPGHVPPRWLTVLGDSAAAGHGLADADDALGRRVGRGLVALDGRATAVRCAARDGATTADVLATQLEAARDAEVVLIGVGVNDALCRERSVEDSAAHLRALVREVRTRAVTNAQVVLLSCPDLSCAPGLPPVLRPVLGRRCRALALAQQRVASELGVPVVRADRSAMSPELFGADGFHPGSRGHERLTSDVLDRLARR
jgi:lysophospholipase L1-like esterase